MSCVDARIDKRRKAKNPQFVWYHVRSRGGDCDVVKTSNTRLLTWHRSTSREAENKRWWTERNKFIVRLDFSILLWRDSPMNHWTDPAYAVSISMIRRHPRSLAYRHFQWSKAWFFIEPFLISTRNIQPSLPLMHVLGKLVRTVSHSLGKSMRKVRQVFDLITSSALSAHSWCD